MDPPFLEKVRAQERCITALLRAPPIPVTFTNADKAAIAAALAEARDGGGSGGGGGGDSKR